MLFETAPVIHQKCFNKSRRRVSPPPDAFNFDRGSARFTTPRPVAGDSKTVSLVAYLLDQIQCGRIAF